MLLLPRRLTACQLRMAVSFGSQVVPPLLVLAGSRFIPYSPRWQLGQNRREKALDIVQRLHATPGDTQHIVVRQEFYLSFN